MSDAPPNATAGTDGDVGAASRKDGMADSSAETLESVLASLHAMQTVVERALETRRRVHLGLTAEQIYPKRGFFGRIRGRFWIPRSPSGFTRDTLLKLSRGVPRSRRLVTMFTARLNTALLAVGSVFAFSMFLGALFSGITGFSPFPNLNDGERSMLTISSGLLSVTMASLLAEHRLFGILRDESSSILQLNEMDEKYAQMARDGIAYYWAIVKNIQHHPRLGRGVSPGEYYRRVASAELGAHRASLRRLAQGTYSAPESQVDQMLDSVLDSVSTYAAVSHRDTAYWRNRHPEALKYRRHLDTASRAKAVMRIFIVSLSDLRDQWDELMEILYDQEGIDVRWGLAIEERLDPSIASLWNSEVEPNLPQLRPDTYDFALVNGGEVATFFIRDIARGERHLLAAFNVPARETAVRACAGLYTRLVSEVWIGSQSFGTDWKRFLPAIMDDRLRDTGPGKPEEFVLMMDRQWKASRLKCLRDPTRQELLRRMGIDPQIVIDRSGRHTPPFEVVRTEGPSLRDDMETFRQILKGDVFATMRLDEVDALCTPEEARQYRRAARELGIKPTWTDSEDSAGGDTARKDD
ncbi:MAG TPA: hypothetical protein VGB92_10405 [Longimicrobium sp.]